VMWLEVFGDETVSARRRQGPAVSGARPDCPHGRGPRGAALLSSRPAEKTPPAVAPDRGRWCFG
jgi:hypothetical protein